MVSILRVACLGVALAAVWAYFAELACREVLISIFFASLIGALFLGSAKKGKGTKGSASEDSDDEDFKEIGLDIAKENIIPSGSRRSTKLPEKYREELVILPVKGAGASAKKAPPSPAKKTPSKSPKKNDTYDVETIVDRKSLNGQTHYLVKWQGFDDDQNTWEPIKNLSKVTSLVEAFDRDADAEEAKPSRSNKRKSVKPPAASSPPKTPKTSSRSSPAKAKAVPQSAPSKSSKAKASPPPKKTTRKSMAPKASVKATPIKKASPSKSPVRTRRSARGGGK